MVQETFYGQQMLDPFYFWQLFSLTDLELITTTSVHPPQEQNVQFLCTELRGIFVNFYSYLNINVNNW